MLKELLVSLVLVNFVYGECPAKLAKDITCSSVATKCYCFSYIQVDWGTANEICRNNTAYPNFRLVSIESAQEQTVLEAFISETPGLEVCNVFGFWTSGSDIMAEGTWTWASTGDRFSYANWAGGQQPNNNAQDCMLLSKPGTYTWDDDDCNSSRAFICEGPA